MAKIKNEITFIPKVKVHPNKIILYNEVHYSHHRPSRLKLSDHGKYLIIIERDGKSVFKEVSRSFLDSSRKTDGTMSKQAIKKLKLAIDYMLLINKPTNGKSGNTGRHYQNNITFITLTLPSQQLHSDKEIKQKCLNQFMIEMHKFWRIRQYIWRAEYQDNGNIHFHIIVNRFIPYSDIRVRWNRIINKLGYIDEYRNNQQKYHLNGFQVRKELLHRWSAKKQKEAYDKGIRENWENPNSTDIHSIKNITNIKAYITKYMTKKEQEKKETFKKDIQEKEDPGRQWAASQILSKIKGADTEIDTQIGENLEHLEEHFKTAFYRSDYFTIIDVSIVDLKAAGCSALLDLFLRYLYDEFHYSHQFSF